METSLTRSTTGSRNRESKAPRRDQKQKKSHSDATIDVTPDRVENLSSNTIPKTTPPSRGKIKTKKRNERRRESKKLAWLKDRGVLPANATKADYHRFLEENPETAERPTRTANKVQYQDDTESRTIFEAKRQALLNSITYGGIEIGTESSRQDKGVEVTTVDEHRPEHDQALEIPATNDNDVSAMPSDMDEVRTAQPNEGPANESTSSSAIQENSDSMTPAVEIKKSSADDTFHIAAAAVVPSSDAATIMEAPTRRSKLDLSGAKRMLFGSLGLKTPKTKDDESVTRAKLMKDIKPVRELQAKTEVESGADVVAASEDDSWREKIDLRAVECCYDGFELSTPPFPFVQRWDPQQQRGFNFGNARKRKGKKRKRNNENYYEDSFNQMSQNKAARHSDYDSPRHEVTTALPEKNSNVEGYDQERIRDESIQDALAANEQLHQETEDTSADRLVEPDHPAALPTLPEDLSSCESLTREKATAGTIVAFKQLDMSAETNWQPIVSEYRTALVAQVLADGTLQMTLAKRDQPTKQIQFDEKNGNRLYSKFEMPGYSDERAGDDSGMIEISFDELINPVVIKAPIEQKYLNQERQDQVRLATPPELGEITVAGRTKNSIDDPEAYGLDGSMEGVVVDDVSTRPNEEARQEISELMRDAGWRSGVHSDLIDHRGKGSPERKDDLENANLIDPPPPKFHGFSSSPLNRDEVESSPLPPEVQTKKPLYEMDVEVTESVPPHGPIDPDAQSMVSMNRSIVDYPHLPQIGDDSDVFEEGGQQRSDPLGLDHHIASQDLESLGSIYQPQPSSVRSSSRASPKHAATKDISLLDIACSDDELPHLFSQAFEARISQEVDIKPELSEDEAISPPSYRKSRRSGKIDAPQRESNGDWNPRWSDSEDGGSTPRLSQAPMPSQIVDLTVSSDSVSVPDDEYIDGEESYRLPEGSGWVNKNRASKPRSLSKNNFPKKRSARSR